MTDPEQVHDFVARSRGGARGDRPPRQQCRRRSARHVRDADRRELDRGPRRQAVLADPLLARGAAVHARAAAAARIVNIGAVYSRYPDPTFFATSVNRAAGNSFTKTLALEVAKDNILVNSVNIGFVTTPQWENIHTRRAPDVPQRGVLRRARRQEVPLGRFGTPDEVSGLVAFLIGSRASYITGASIDVAGGMGKYV